MNIVGCTATAPLVPVKYEEPAYIKTDQSVTIELETGVVTGSSGSTLVSGGGVYVPKSTGPVSSLHFGLLDQSAFIETLSSELIRLGIVDVLQTGHYINVDAEHAIKVVFLKTHHNPHSQVYTLDVEFKITNGDNVLENTYQITSHTSMKEKWFTNASQGKQKAAKKLLTALIQDIQKYLMTLNITEN